MWSGTYVFYKISGDFWIEISCQDSSSRKLNLTTKANQLKECGIIHASAILNTLPDKLCYYIADHESIALQISNLTKLAFPDYDTLRLKKDLCIEAFRRETKETLLHDLSNEDVNIDRLLDALCTYTFSDGYSCWMYDKFTEHYIMIASSMNDRSITFVNAKERGNLSRYFRKMNENYKGSKHIDLRISKDASKFKYVNRIKIEITNGRGWYTIPVFVNLYSIQEDYELRRDTVALITELTKLRFSKYINKYLFRILMMNREISSHYSSLSLNDFCNQCVKSICEILKWEASSIFIKEGNNLVLKSTWNNKGEYPKKTIQYNINDNSKTSGIFNSNKGIDYSYDISTDTRNSHTYDEPTTNPARTWVGVKLELQSDKIGVLRVKNKIENGTPTPFNSIDISILKEIASIISSLIRAEKTFEKDLEQKDDELSRRSEEFSNMINTLRVLKHELRTPIEGIFGAVKTIPLVFYKENLIPNTYFSNKHYPKIKQKLDSISVAGERLLFLADLFTMEDEGFIEATQHCLVYKDVIEKLADTLSPVFEMRERKLLVKTSTINRLPSVKCKPITSVMAMNILLDNALKYSDANTTIEVWGEEDPFYSSILVSNHGMSILDSEKELIFQKFQRGSMPKNENVQGMGIGLDLCKKIMKNMGGDVLLVKNSSPVIFKLRFRIMEE